MTQRARPTVDIDLLVRKAQFTHRYQRHDCKRFVDLEQIDVIQRPACLAQQTLNGAYRCGWKQARLISKCRMCVNTAKGRNPRRCASD
ncbi:hypothetical protein PSE10A_30670 [Pseudomonas amygdali pv. eriobotryae]|uniref:Uncharacterized protein n=1 Tax=Pseudomonas amygdali pv. eriobotryae TaxID=129137 RepID=A0A9P3AF50_PSEA0|nr:hypothetical protein PSE10A_30670 [Pseudomonas amygdali pv. eriobotryae]